MPATCPSAGAARVNHRHSREVELVGAGHDIRWSGRPATPTSQADSCDDFDASGGDLGLQDGGTSFQIVVAGSEHQAGPPAEVADHTDLV